MPQMTCAVNLVGCSYQIPSVVTVHPLRKTFITPIKNRFAAYFNIIPLSKKFQVLVNVFGFEKVLQNESKVWYTCVWFIAGLFQSGIKQTRSGNNTTLLSWQRCSQLMVSIQFGKLARRRHSLALGWCVRSRGV